AAEPAVRGRRPDRVVAYPQAGQRAMTTLDRYVLREWAKVFFLATFGFPLLVFVIVLVDIGLTELAPVTSSRRAELLGEKQIRSDQYRNNFVYRADGGWVYAIGGLELARHAMRDLIMEREGTGPEYPTIVIAAPQASYDTARRARGWTLTKGTVHY